MKRIIIMEVDDGKNLAPLEEDYMWSEGAIVSASECAIEGDKITIINGSNLLSGMRYLGCPEFGEKE